MRGRRMHAAVVLTLLLTVGALSGALSLDARVNIKPGFNAFSPAQDVELGREAEQQVAKQMALVNDPGLDGYINRLGKKLASHAPGYQFPYRFSVVSNKQINAFAIPGGHVYVYSGTIAAAANEAQLAGVLAHEISHVALRHSTNQASKAMLAQAPLAILGGIFSGGVGQLAQLGVSFGLNSVFLKFSRTAESQADELGSQIMYDAGYDPRAMAQFFETIQRQGGSGTVQFLSDHPNPGNRIQDVERLIPQLGPSKDFVTDTRDFDQMKQSLSGLRSGGSSQRGSDERGNPPEDAMDRTQPPPRPSGRPRNFSGTYFNMQYQDNWRVSGESSGALTIVPPGGVLRGDSAAPSEIAYGALSSIFQANEGRRQPTLAEASQQLLDQLTQSNPRMQVDSRSQRNTQVDGQNAYSITATGQSPLGGAEVDWIVTSLQPDGLWYVIFIAPQRDWNNYRSVYEQMLNSVRFPR